MEQEFDELPKSKSQIKRELHELQALGKTLVALPDKQLMNIPISDKLKDAIHAANTMKHGALSRQLKYIANLMPDEDALAIRTALDKLTKSHQKSIDEFHEVEAWRDRLLQGDQVLFDSLVESFDDFERQYVNQLIRNAKKELKLDKSPKSARQLFQYLSELKKRAK